MNVSRRGLPDRDPRSGFYNATKWPSVPFGVTAAGGGAREVRVTIIEPALSRRARVSTTVRLRAGDERIRSRMKAPPQSRTPLIDFYSFSHRHTERQLDLVRPTEQTRYPPRSSFSATIQSCPHGRSRGRPVPYEWGTRRSRIALESEHGSSK